MLRSRAAMGASLFLEIVTVTSMKRSARLPTKLIARNARCPVGCDCCEIRVRTPDYRVKTVRVIA